MQQNQTVRTICLVEDQGITRDCLIHCFRDRLCLEIIMADNYPRAVELARQKKFDLIIVTSFLKKESLLTFLSHFSKISFSSRIIILAKKESYYFYQQVHHSGIQGIVSINESFDTLIYAIEQVIRGHRWVSQAIEEMLLCEIDNQAHCNKCKHEKRGEKINIDSFTDRERQIVKLLSKELTIDEIASHIHLSEGMVRYHLKHMYDRMGVKGHIGLLGSAYRYGLLDD